MRRSTGGAIGTGGAEVIVDIEEDAYHEPQGVRRGEVMDDRQEFDVASIVQHIRENLRHRRRASTPYTPEPFPDDAQTPAELAALHSNHDIYRIHFTSHRKAFGWVIVLAKKLVRQLLTPSLERQVAYNAANMRLSSHLWECLQETRAQLQEARAQLQETCERQAMLQSKIEVLHYQQGQLRGEIEAVGQRQESALQALQAAVIAQMDGWGQQQMKSLQFMCDAIIAQVQPVGQYLEDRDRRLTELERGDDGGEVNARQPRAPV